MDQLLKGYDLGPATWFYLSLLLIIAIYFRFHRVWSLRNVDLWLLLCASPGLICLNAEAADVKNFGETLLAMTTGAWLVRLLFDRLLQRRPHTTQNLNPAGLAFLCASAFVMLSLHSTRVEPADETDNAVKQAEEMLHRVPTSDAVVAEAEPGIAGSGGPTFRFIAAWFEMAFQSLKTSFSRPEEVIPHVMAMSVHLAVILGLLLIGRNLFGDLQLGTAMATLYMLLPCTAMSVQAFIHVLPAALVVWAVVAYQRPVVSGAILGLACGTLVFPVFLVPLWTVFYGRKGGVRFITSLALVTIALLGTYAFTSADPVAFWRQAITTIKLPLHALLGEDVAVSSWTEISAPHRIPIVAGYFVMLIALTVWPREKSVEHLIANSAALIVGAQFWYPQQMGVSLMWYLPLLLIVVFRPRIAQLTQNRLQPEKTEVKVAPEPTRASSTTTRVAAGNALKGATLFR